MNLAAFVETFIFEAKAKQEAYEEKRKLWRKLHPVVNVKEKYIELSIEELKKKP